MTSRLRNHGKEADRGLRARAARRACIRLLLALGVLVAILAPTSADVAGASSSASSTTSLPYLHVVIPTTGSDRTPYLADPQGREILLRGVAAVGLQDVAYPGANGGPALFPVNPSSYTGKCPSAFARIPQPPLCEVEATRPAYDQSSAPGSGDDFAEMRALGFDLVRLVLNWSQLEPTPGAYNQVYLDRVAQVVGWAKQQGIYVILDMHQDQYSRFILPGPTQTTALKCSSSGGSDGAPKWAVFTNGKPACAIEGQSALNPASSAAFYNFWQNHTVSAKKGQAPGTGLEDHYIGALAALAKRFEKNPAVLGYELMNEPQPGSLTSLPLANAYQSSANDLYPFYKRAVEALTGVRDGLPTCSHTTPTTLSNHCAYPAVAHVSKQQIFFEPIAYRNLIDFSPQASKPFSTYPNLVYAPHVYTHAFTVDQFLGYSATASPYPPNFTFGYQSAESDAQAMHAADLTTEFGDSSATDGSIVSNEVAAQEATLTGGTLWAWKGLSQTETSCWCVRWQKSAFQTTSNGTPGKGNPHASVSKNDQLIPSRQSMLEMVWPRTTAGRLLAEHFDPATKTFAMTALAPSKSNVRRGTRTEETVIYIPASAKGAVALTAAVIDTIVKEPDGSRLAYVAPTTRGSTYSITVGNPPAAVRALVKNEAIHPLAPITEPKARGTALAALQVALSSSNSKIRSQAALATVLAKIVLGGTDPNPPSVCATCGFRSDSCPACP